MTQENEVVQPITEQADTKQAEVKKQLKLKK